MAEQFGFQKVLRYRGAVQGDERATGASRFAVNVPGQNLFAGTGLAADQHGGIGPRDLLGAFDGGVHDFVTHDHGVGFAGRGLEDGGDQIGIGRQREEFARTGVNGADGGVGVVAGAAGDDRHRHAFGGERGDDGADVVRDVAQHQIDVRVGAQADQCAVGIIRLIEPGAAADGDPGRLAQVTGEGADDQDFHGRGSGGAWPRTPPGGVASWTSTKGSGPWNHSFWLVGREGPTVKYRGRSRPLSSNQPMDRLQRASPFAGVQGRVRGRSPTASTLTTVPDRL